MEEDKVVDIHKDAIVLTNGEISMLVSQPTQVRMAFDKLQQLSVRSGKVQYWVYRIWKKCLSLRKDAEDVRVRLVREFCKKGEDGEPALLLGPYEFDPDQKVLHDAEINEKKPTTSEEVAVIAEKYCKKDSDGKPIRKKTENVSFDDEGMAKFQTAFAELMNAENVLPFNRIKIDSEILGKMNEGEEKPIDVNDMMVLEKIVDFVE